jgi:3-oxoacyl-[acyl-carrier-protein] synthase-3
MEMVMDSERHAYVTAWGVSLPNEPVDNGHIEAVLGQVQARSSRVKRRVLMNNGIVSRYYAIDPVSGDITHSNARLTADAIRNLRGGSGFSTDDIQCLACGTSSADQVIPGHASMVHAELDCPPCDIISASGVCCAGVSALKYGFLNVVSGACDNAVVTGSELSSPSLRASHFSAQVATDSGESEDHDVVPFSNEFLRWMLSDGAGALLIESKPNADGLSLRIDWIDVMSFANESEVCMYFGLRKKDDGTTEGYRTVHDHERFVRQGFLSLGQDVRVLNDRLPALMGSALSRIKEKRRLSPACVDWLLPHYSSQWFRQRLYDGLSDLGLEIPWERWFTNLTTKGNTGSAALYIMLEELMTSGRVSRGQHLLGIVPESARMVFGFVHFTVV